MFLRRRRSHQVLSRASNSRPTTDATPRGTTVDYVSLKVPIEFALRAAVQVAGATAAAIGLLCDGQLVCRARAGDIAPDLDVALNVSTGITGACFRSGQTLHCEDAEMDARVDASVCRSLGIRSIVVVPIMVNGVVTGILEALSSNHHAFKSEHIRWLTRVANFVQANARAATAPSISPQARPSADPRSSEPIPQPPIVEPMSFASLLEECQDSKTPTENPELAVALKALPSSPTATWDEIYEQLASSFR
jgi:putative methionine-R-sulfoxide reductase with GAF domain